MPPLVSLFQPLLSAHTLVNKGSQVILLKLQCKCYHIVYLNYSNSFLIHSEKEPMFSQSPTPYAPHMPLTSSTTTLSSTRTPVQPQWLPCHSSNTTGMLCHQIVTGLTLFMSLFKCFLLKRSNKDYYFKTVTCPLSHSMLFYINYLYGI